jgi:hypothetical protein
MDELKKFVLLYVLFEPAFFHFAGEKRKNNIHCVPLTYTALAANYGNTIGSQAQQWSKYTAFNLLPVRNQGSVEFRHLGGTGDVNRYVKWLTMIKDLRDAALDDRSLILSRILGTRQNITELYASIFGHLCPLPEGAFARSLIDVKEALIKTQAKKLEALLQKDE